MKLSDRLSVKQKPQGERRQARRREAENYNMQFGDAPNEEG